MIEQVSYDRGAPLWLRTGEELGQERTNVERPNLPWSTSAILLPSTSSRDFCVKNARRQCTPQSLATKNFCKLRRYLPTRTRPPTLLQQCLGLGQQRSRQHDGQIRGIPAFKILRGSGLTEQSAARVLHVHLPQHCRSIAGHKMLPQMIEDQFVRPIRPET